LACGFGFVLVPEGAELGFAAGVAGFDVAAPFTGDLLCDVLLLRG
jgi:hypothetical protein